MDAGIIIVTPNIKPDHDDYIVVTDGKEGATFKQLKKYGAAQILHPFNPTYPDIELSAKYKMLYQTSSFILI